MKLATLHNGRPDGQLVVVSGNLKRFVSAGRIAPSLSAALENWETSRPALEELGAALDAGAISSLPLDVSFTEAPLPRVSSLLLADAYPSAGERMHNARRTAGTAQRAHLTRLPGDGLASATATLSLPPGEFEIDVEPGLAFVSGGLAAHGARKDVDIRLVMLGVTLVLRNLVGDEWGDVNSRPLTAFSPVAAPPEELGLAWRDGRVHLKLRLAVNGNVYGMVDTGADLGFDPAELVAGAAQMRPFGANGIILAAPVSARHEETLPLQRDGIGFASIAEAQAAEQKKYGRTRTPFLKPGDIVEVAALAGDGTAPLGAITVKVARG